MNPEYTTTLHADISRGETWVIQVETKDPHKDLKGKNIADEFKDIVELTNFRTRKPQLVEIEGRGYLVTLERTAHAAFAKDVQIRVAIPHVPETRPVITLTE